MTIVQLPFLCLVPWPHVEIHKTEIILIQCVCMFDTSFRNPCTASMAIKYINWHFRSTYENSPLPASISSVERFYLLTIDTIINNNGKDFRGGPRVKHVPFLNILSSALLIDAGLKYFLSLLFIFKNKFSCYSELGFGCPACKREHCCAKLYFLQKKVQLLKDYFKKQT